MTISVLPEDPDNPYRLGAHLDHDPKNADYPLAAITESVAPPATPRPVRWNRYVPVWDQGNVPMCVAEAVSGFAVTDPYYPLLSDSQHAVAQNPAHRQELYVAANGDDGIIGKHEGTTANAGFKYAHVLDLQPPATAEYDWVYGHTNVLAEALAYLDRVGPLLLCCPWHQDMFAPDSYGFVSPVGEIVGGHATLITWHAAKDGMFNGSPEAVLVDNSWSTNWCPQLEGSFRMSIATLDQLFSEGATVSAWYPTSLPTP